MRGAPSHIEIYVSDIEKSAVFWGWLLQELGYAPFQTWDKGRSWKLGGFYFVIVQVEAPFNATYHRKNVGLNHVAFHADNAADVQRMTKTLEEKGVPILYADRHPHAGGADHIAVYFEDPDKIKVEFSAG
jgi:catechol 2,3-dioxygenase-like lactoylglutathione lyase family enzyme